MLRVVLVAAAAWLGTGLLLALAVGRAGRRSGAEPSLALRPALTVPPVPTTVEDREGDAAVVSDERAPLAGVVPLRRRPRLARAIVSAAAVAALILLTGATTNGALPAVAQDQISSLADRVGIDLPTSREDVVRVERVSPEVRNDDAESSPATPPRPTAPANDDARPAAAAGAPGHDPAGPGRSEETPPASDTPQGRPPQGYAPDSSADHPGGGDDAPGRSGDAPGRAEADERGRLSFD